MPSVANRPAIVGGRRVLQMAVLAAPVVWILFMGWTHRWMTEDGFIYLRIVRQIRTGHGPVFNGGERVEAFTGPLWVGVLALADLVTPIRLEWLSVLLGLAGTVTGVVLALVGSRCLWRLQADERLFLPLGSVLFVAVFPVWTFATSGLETGLVFAWLGACLWILSRWARGPGERLSALGAVILGLGWLVRPEMVLFSAVFLLVVVAMPGSGNPWRQRVRVVGAALALPVAYQFLRMGYYGSLVANTAVAKEGSSTNWGRGWRYFSDFAGPYWLWVPALGLLAGGYFPLGAVLAAGHERRRYCVASAFAACGVLNATYVIAVGGDYHHGRMFLPALFAVCAPVAAVPATRRHLAGLVVAGWAVVAALTLRPDQLESDNWLANGFLAQRQSGSVTTNDYGWGEAGARRAWYTGPAYYHEGGILEHLRTDMPTTPGLPLPYGAFWGVGVSSYAMGPDFHVLDLLGLADSFTAHLQDKPSLVPGIPRYAGHEKPLPSPWVAARVTPASSRPDPQIFPSFGNPLIPPKMGREFQEQVAWARAALRCDAVVELLRSVEAPLTPSRFFDNVVRAAENTRLHIPPDPEVAFHRFCGPGMPPEVRDVRSEQSPPR